MIKRIMLTIMLTLGLIVPTLAISIKECNEKNLGNKTPLRFTTIGTSMEPTIKNGNTIWTYRAKNKDLQEKDIVTYRLRKPIKEHGQYTTHVTHRITNKGKVIYNTKGDNNQKPDKTYFTHWDTHQGKVNKVYMITQGKEVTYCA